VVGEVYNVCSGRSYTLDRVLQVLEELTQHRPLVTLNKQLVRSNEVARICGDPKKLNECIGEKFDIELRTTLMWMLT
jgi:nucleoside-diphosphate-sugar epimerase